jgi:CxxC-x17-CxxC domain-containing protein
MSAQDKSIQCSDCGTTFIFSVRDQEFFKSKNFISDPKRCSSCRQTRKSEHNGNSSYQSPRQMFPATCSECGKSTEVPFQPSDSKPVYCNDCYRKVRSVR